MIGIYNDDFAEYLRSKLGSVKTTTKNIIIPCPFCEYGKSKDHYHMYISIEAPIFHCFRAGCEKSGTIKKLLNRIEGKDISENFIDKEKIAEFKSKERFIISDDSNKDIIYPDLKLDIFKEKEMYLRKRLKFHNISLSEIKGLIFDVNEFININQLVVDEKLFRMRDYLHNNFIGFVTNKNGQVIFRNIDDSQDFRYFKLKLNSTPFLDYYKLPGDNPESNKIVLAEGIFDIFSEYLFDHLNIKNDVRLYASSLSSKYSILIYSIIFNEEIFKPEIIILSDNGIKLKQYKTLKKYNYPLIKTLSVYYNKTGKDFNDSPVTPVYVHV